MMKLLKHGLFALLALLSVACTQDSQDALEHIGVKPEASTKISLEGLSFSLDNESEFRHIGMEHVQNSKGQIVPFPALQDGQKVPLTVAIANTTNSAHAYLATSATYEAASKRLIVANDEYKLIDFISGKTEDTPDSLFFTAGETYYMCAVLGGTPITSLKPGRESEAYSPERGFPKDPYSVYNFEWTKPLASDKNLRLWDVRFEYSEVLSPVLRQVGEKLDLNIAYKTKWTELEVTKVVNAAAGDHRVVTFTKKGLRFEPEGNILALQIGNLTSRDVPIDAINFVYTRGEVFDFGGHIPLNEDSNNLSDGAELAFYSGIYLEGRDLDNDAPITRFSLGNKPVLKANQAKQYTYYIWVPYTNGGPVSFEFEKDGQPIAQPVQMPVVNSLGSTNWYKTIRFTITSPMLKTQRKIYFLEMNIKE